MNRWHMMVMLVTVGWFVASSYQADGGIYQYEDGQGTVHFVDDPSKIPRKYRNRQTVRDNDTGTEESRVTSIIIRNNRVLVPVTLCYRGKEEQARFILDTGASSSTISPELARRLNVDLSNAQRGVARGVGGGVYAVQGTRLDYLTVGPNRIYDLGVVIIESTQADGLLGMDFLRERRYHIDFHNHTITWGH